MKTVLLAILSTAVGTAVGVGFALAEFSREPGIEIVATNTAGRGVPVPAAPPSGQPRVEVVGESDYDFGVMEKGETLSHTFVIKNMGDAPLTLGKERTTCKCTLSKLERNSIPPGETAEVTLEWTAKSFARQFRQTAVIRTNDPRHRLLSLDVHGRVIQPVRPQPQDIVFSSVSATEARTAEVYVYNYRHEEFTLELARFARPETAQHFDVQIEPLPEEIVAEEPDAKSGVRLSVTLQPGMPLGIFKQKIVLQPVPSDLPEVVIPVSGNVTGDISVFAGRALYDPDRKIVTIGTVPQDEGGRYDLQVMVKGPHAANVKLSVGQVDPADVLNVSIDADQPSSLAGGAVLMYPMTIAIPPGSRSVSRLGAAADGLKAKLGKIVIETTHPQTKQLVLYVQFAVGG